MNKSKKFAGNSRMSRTELNRIYGKKKSRPDAECFEKDTFAVSTIMGCGFDFRGRFPAFELYEFLKYFNFKITPEVWNRLLDQHKSAAQECWPVFEKREGNVVVAWFQKSMLISDWVPVAEPCPFTKKIVPFKNGWFKTVPIVNRKRKIVPTPEEKSPKRSRK